VHSMLQLQLHSMCGSVQLPLQEPRTYTPMNLRIVGRLNACCMPFACDHLRMQTVSVKSGAEPEDQSQHVCSQVMSGTSMAAPHVGGVAALYLQYRPGASPQEVKVAVMRAAAGEHPRICIVYPACTGVHATTAETPTATLVNSALMCCCSLGVCSCFLRVLLSAAPAQQHVRQAARSWASAYYFHTSR
jgi:hypothetical protein